MSKWMILVAVVLLSAVGLGCEDGQSAGDALKDAASSVGDAIEDSGKQLGEKMEEGKQKMRDAAEEIENE